MLKRGVPHPVRPGGGFTMVEVLVALAIVAVLSAVVLPSLLGKLRDSRTTSLSQTFLGLSQGIAEYKRATTKYPSSLLLLTTAPTSASLDICGGAISTTPASLWRGPYASRIIVSTGIKMGDANIPTGLRRVVVGSAIFLVIDAEDVETATANDLEAQLDGNNDAAAGTIRSTSASIASTPTSAVINASDPGTLNVSYAIPINSC